MLQQLCWLALHTSFSHDAGKTGGKDEIAIIKLLDEQQRQVDFSDCGKSVLLRTNSDRIHSTMSKQTILEYIREVYKIYKMSVGN